MEKVPNILSQMVVKKKDEFHCKKIKKSPLNKSQIVAHISHVSGTHTILQTMGF